MALTTKIEPRKDYLCVRIEGPFELQSSYLVSNAILDAVEKNQATKIFVDFRGVTGNLEPMERFQYAEMFSKKYMMLLNAARIKRARFAFLGKYPQWDPQKFDETVAVNRGVSIRATNDPKEAFEWLGVEQEPGILNS